MLLKKLILENYKTYYGTQEVDLYIPKEVREENKNIILLGGLNGAGKTTILKAILYVLFGKRGMSDTEYKQLFSNAINNSFYDEGGRHCSVTLVLETDSLEEWTLKVKWHFDKFKRASHEERDIIVSKKNSNVNQKARIDNLEAYNKLIDKIIPYHAAPFFVFDGEEIKEIILRQNSNEMKQAIQKISGMDAYQALLSDLKSLEDSIHKSLASAVSQSKISNFQTELIELDGIIKKYENTKDKYISKIKKFEEILDKTKDDRTNKMLQNSNSRDTIVKRQSRLETELKIIKDEYNSFFDENVLGIILGEKIRKLKNQVKLESELNKKRIMHQSNLVPYNNFMEKLLNQNITPPLTSAQLKQIKQIGQDIWMKENNIKESIPEDYKEIHDLSNKDYTTLINYAVKDKVQIVNLVNKVEKIEGELNQLESEIRSAPQTVNIDEENKKIDSVTKTIGEFNAKLRSVNNKLTNAQADRTNITNKLTRLSDKDVNLEELQKQYNLIRKTIVVMNKYIAGITEMKAKFIRDEFSTMLEKLFRKQKEFGKIEFDINTYAIRLYNDRMQEISIKDRSAGEMQMISSALIWALTKASDLSLPIVVDTPLGRLDSYHRNHLINYYYKELSEQVIILSTDTEITKEYVKIMEDHSYKQYLLDYDEEKKYTVIRDGYFKFVTE